MVRCFNEEGRLGRKADTLCAQYTGAHEPGCFKECFQNGDTIAQSSKRPRVAMIHNLMKCQTDELTETLIQRTEIHEI